MKKQSKGGEEVDSRYIWSAMSGAPYLGNWDNFNVANYNAIRSLFDRLGYACRITIIVAVRDVKKMMTIL